LPGERTSAEKGFASESKYAESKLKQKKGRFEPIDQADSCSKSLNLPLDVSVISRSKQFDVSDRSRQTARERLNFGDKTQTDDSISRQIDVVGIFGCTDTKKLLLTENEEPAGN
jgi:hypothetical protein